MPRSAADIDSLGAAKLLCCYGGWLVTSDAPGWRLLVDSLYTRQSWQ
jgi:hypothetical protein